MVSDDFKNEVGALDYEDQVIRFARIGKEIKSFEEAQKKIADLAEQRQFLGELCGLLQPTKPRAQRGTGVSAASLLDYINREAPYTGTRELSAKDIEASFPGQNVRNALAKLSKDGKVYVNKRGPGKLGGNSYKQLTPAEEPAKEATREERQERGGKRR